MIEHAGEGLRAFLNPPRASALTYVEGSQIPLGAVIVAIAAVPDAFVLWLALPHGLWWLALLVDVLEIWGALWLFGLYGTMARSPHLIADGRVRLHNGALQTLEFERSNVAAAASLGSIRRRKLPRKRGDGSAVLALPGVPIVDIRLRNPVRGVNRIFVASDRPEALCALVGPELTPSSSG